VKQGSDRVQRGNFRQEWSQRSGERVLKEYGNHLGDPLRIMEVLPRTSPAACA
jgi:hypothetical protein